MFPLHDRLEYEQRSLPRRVQNLISKPMVVDRYHKSPDEIGTILTQLQKKDTIEGLGLYTTNPMIFEIGPSYEEKPIPYVILATREGETLLGDRDFFFALEHGIARYPDATRVRGGNGITYRVPYEGTVLYVKQDDYDNKFPGAPLYEFMAGHLLSTRGVFTAPLLLATNSGTVTVEVPERPLTDREYEPFNYPGITPKHVKTYYEAVNEVIDDLKQAGLWVAIPEGRYYVADLKTPHLFPRNIYSSDPLDWFTFIDTVAVGIPLGWFG